MQKKILISILFIIFVLTNILSAADEKPAEQKKNEGIPIYTFRNDEEIKLFIELLQNKQSVLNKYSILENYRLIEQNNIDQVSGQLLLKYKVDPSKNYSLDQKNNQLLEQPPETKNTNQNQNATAHKADGKVIHKFETEDDIKAFVQFIQLKQNVLNKITVLQNYQLIERANLESVNGQLMLKFKIDPAKNYSLDQEKKIIYEVIQQQQAK